MIILAQSEQYNAFVTSGEQGSQGWSRRGEEQDDQRLVMMVIMIWRGLQKKLQKHIFIPLFRQDASMDAFPKFFWRGFKILNDLTIVLMKMLLNKCIRDARSIHLLEYPILPSVTKKPGDTVESTRIEPFLAENRVILD